MLEAVTGPTPSSISTGSISPMINRVSPSGSEGQNEETTHQTIIFYKINKEILRIWAFSALTFRQLNVILKFA